MTEENDFIVDQNPEATKEGIEAAAAALEEIRNRSFSGRNPHLGRMINCAFCGLRHRENHFPECKQTFATKTREGDPIQGELQPPEGLTNLTARQTYGAAMFNKRRQKPRTRPTKPLTKWQRIIVEAHKRKHAKA